MVRVLGLDIGIASIGHSIVEFDVEDFSGKFLNLGVRIFTAAEQPKTGASLALPRREARSARKRLARRSSRLYNIRKLLLENGFITQAEMEEVYYLNEPDIWDLRKEALDRKISSKEFYRILIHIAKRRGFKSIRKSEEAKITSKKDCWLEITDEYQFLFSLFPDTLIAINPTGRPEDEFLGYYKCCDISSGVLKIDSPDRNIVEKRFSTKTAAYIKKYQVGILGDYYEVKHEKRLGIKKKGNVKNGV